MKFGPNTGDERPAGQMTGWAFFYSEEAMMLFHPIVTSLAQQVTTTPEGVLATAVLLVTVANRLTEGLVKPIFVKLQLDTFWLMYIAWLVGGALVWLSGVNLFASSIPNALAGKILSALVAGGGANLLNDLFSKKAA